jgi:membrane protease YdiL (CAAX protease family)
MMYLAEILPSTRPFWEYSNPPPALIAASLFFMLLICIGVAIDVGLVLHGIKRPARSQALEGGLTARALPGQMVLIFLGILITFYFLASWLWLSLFPDTGVEPWTVIFQTLLFHLPVLAGLGVLLRMAGIRGDELFGLHWKKAPRQLGLSLVLYLAMLPPLWLISAIYQFVLQQAGCDFYLQDVAALLTAPAPWFLRTALFLIVILVAPVFEEIVFRGVLFPALVRRVGFWPGLVLISLVFGGLHLHLPSFLPLFLLSAVFCLAYARTQSLWVPIGMHILFNSVTVILLLLMGG